MCEHTNIKKTCCATRGDDWLAECLFCVLNSAATNSQIKWSISLSGEWWFYLAFGPFISPQLRHQTLERENFLHFSKVTKKSFLCFCFCFAQQFHSSSNTKGSIFVKVKVNSMEFVHRVLSFIISSHINAH